jgi:hypothetical protein
MEHTETMPNPKTTKRIPENAVTYRRELKPLPLRVATSQYERLAAARNRTGISIQEHIRRSIDLYLAVIEREAIELGHMASPDASPMSPGRLPDKPKIAKR